MNFKKLGVLSVFALLVTFAFTTSLPRKTFQTRTGGSSTSMKTYQSWDINQAQSLNTGGVGFTFNQLSTGWFTVYLNTNYLDLTDKTSIIADTSWTPSAQPVNRSLTSRWCLFPTLFPVGTG